MWLKFQVLIIMEKVSTTLSGREVAQDIETGKFPEFEFASFGGRKSARDIEAGTYFEFRNPEEGGFAGDF